MSDTRFTMIGIALIFAGFVTLGIAGTQFLDASVQLKEFDDCYEYFDDAPPVKVPCDAALLAKTAFFALVIGLIAAGVLFLIKGARGDWDQKVRPQDMVGPGDKSKP